MWRTTLTLVAFLLTCSHALPSDFDLTNPLLYRRAADPTDLSWLKTWAAVGDSWASGIGSGTLLNGDGDYDCSRYDRSYPVILNSMLTPEIERTFNFEACASAKNSDTLAQLKKFAAKSQDLITISTSGNDIDPQNLLNLCIFQWNAPKNPFTSLCDNAISVALKDVRKDSFVDGVTDVVKSAEAKLNKDNPHARIYVVGYARLFDASDDQCDAITWAYWWQLDFKEYLTKKKRGRFNELVLALNSVLNEAVGRQESGRVHYVDYDDFYAQSRGRFCEAGYPETQPNRAGLLFYEWDTDDNAEPTDDQTAGNQNITSYQVKETLVMNGTFEDQVGEWISQTLEKHPKWNSTWTKVGGAPPSIDSTNPTKEQRERGFTVRLIPDSYGKVFHPRPNGHNLIAKALLWTIKHNYANDLNVNFPPAVITSDICKPAAAATAPTTSKGPSKTSSSPGQSPTSKMLIALNLHAKKPQDIQYAWDFFTAPASKTSFDLCSPATTHTASLNPTAKLTAALPTGTFPIGTVGKKQQIDNCVYHNSDFVGGTMTCKGEGGFYCHELDNAKKYNTNATCNGNNVGVDWRVECTW